MKEKGVSLAHSLSSNRRTFRDETSFLDGWLYKETSVQGGHDAVWDEQYPHTLVSPLHSPLAAIPDARKFPKIHKFGFKVLAGLVNRRYGAIYPTALATYRKQDPSAQPTKVCASLKRMEGPEIQTN